MKREVLEETGLIIQHPELCGVKQFQDNTGARYIVLLYKTKHFTGELRFSDEGEVYWIKREDLLDLLSQMTLKKWLRLWRMRN